MATPTRGNMARELTIKNSDATATPAEGRQLLTFEKHEWYTPVLFMLCLSATGLRFYPALLFVIVLLVKAFRQDRYSFVVMLTITIGGYGLIDPKMISGIRFSDLATIASLALFFIYRKSPQARQTVVVLVAYFVALFILATYSIESMSIQLITLRNYLEFVYFIIPVACFAGRDFDIRLFFRRIIQFSVIMSVFYILDAYLFCGNILVPLSFIWGNVVSTFYDPYWLPLSFDFPRKFPIGMYFVLLSLYPIIRYYKIAWWMWGVLILGVLCTRTFTLFITLVVTGIYLIGGFKRFFKYGMFALVGLAAIYFVDSALPRGDDDSRGSTLRIASSVDQFIDLFSMVDAEDLAEFGTGRMAQIIPKVELVQQEGRQWTGLGFLHGEKTHISRYVIDNEYYEDVSRREELAFDVENIPVQVFLTVGYIGLAVHILFFVALMWVVRHDRLRLYFNSMIFMCFVMGMSGLARMIDFQGLGLCALAYAAVLLQHYRSNPDGYEQQDS